MIEPKNTAMNDEDEDITDAQMLRKMAEEKLKEKQNKTEKPVIESDLKRIMHELQVHQIELEMQNEELRKAYETAETALKNYTMLYDLAPVGFFTLNFEGNICELNFTGARILGDRRFSLVNRNFKLFVDEDSLPVFNNFFNLIYTSNAKESCEVMLAYDNTPLGFVYMEGITTGDNQKCLLSMIDISRFKNQNNH